MLRTFLDVRGMRLTKIDILGFMISMMSTRYDQQHVTNTGLRTEYDMGMVRDMSGTILAMIGVMIGMVLRRINAMNIGCEDQLYQKTANS